jgi:hypothetical protein
MRLLKISILTLLAASVLTALPITVRDSTIRYQQAFAEVPVCADGGVISTSPCARYICAQQGPCRKHIGWRQEPIKGGAAYENVSVYRVDQNGCIKLRCAGGAGTLVRSRVCRAYSRCDGCPTGPPLTMVECRVGAALKVGADCG